MAAELGNSQISALLESVPGIANVLRSPVADAIVNLIRSAAGVEPFTREDAEELVQYAVRRGLIGADEGDQVLADVRGKGRKNRGGGPRKPARTPARKKAPAPAGAARTTRRPVKKQSVKKRR